MVIDILVGLVLLISALISFLRGFIREVLTIFGTIGAIAAAFFTGPSLSPLMRGWLGVKEGEPVPELFDIIPYTIVADALSYGLVFLTVLVLLSIVSHVLAETVRKIGLGAVDRSLGVVFGLARGFIILALIYIPANLFAGPEKMDSWFSGSKSRFYIDICADWLTDLLPEGTFGNGPAGNTEGPSEARQKLEQMQLLKGGETAQKIQDALKNGLNPEDILKSLSEKGLTTPDQKPAEKGYTEEFRQQMDQLFKEGDPASTATPAPIPSSIPQPNTQPAQASPANAPTKP